LQLTLLGTGCPQVDTGRYGPASLVRRGSRVYLVDCGSGAAIDALFLTHLHSDHLVDLFQLVISSWHQGRDRPQIVYGPKGTRRFVDATLAAWKPDLDQRIAHERRPSTKALEIEVREFEAGVLLEEEGLRVAAVAVAHQPVRYAYGFVFVFEAEGRKLVLSGDTAYCPTLIEAAQGADVLVHECYIHREMKPSPSRTPEGQRNVAAYHTLSHEVGKVAAAAGARCLVLNHFVPVRFDKDALLAEVRRDYAGPIVVGEDLMHFDLAAGTLRHEGGVIGLAY
jgi:ribonuclease BN (tRNA processing enzyme)